MIGRLVLACLLLAAPVGAQEPAGMGAGAVLRWIDKISSEHGDITIANAASAQVGGMQVQLGECRYPLDDPAGDAFAFVTVRVGRDPQPVFSGWMVASAPALNPLEHPRYDMWVLRCVMD